MHPKVFLMIVADAFPCRGLAGEDEMCYFLVEGYDESNV